MTKQHEGNAKKGAQAGKKPSAGAGGYAKESKTRIPEGGAKKEKKG